MGTTTAQRREDELRAYAHDWDTAFERALQAAAGDVEGLECILRSGGTLPSLHWAGDTYGGYWVGAGLVHIAGVPVDQLRGFAWLHYTRGSEGGALQRDERPLDLGAIATPEPALVAALVVAAAQRHRAA